MSLLVLMYHHAREGHIGNSPEMLDAHFAHLSTRYRCVLPGEPLAPDQLNLCLTFDDAYLDFYTVVFPLLRKYELRAMLAVSPKLIREPAEVPVSWRASANPFADVELSPEREFCNWAELGEMAASGIVTMAAHGLTHVRLDGREVDLEQEVERPQLTLAERLEHPVHSFVFPFGRFSQAVLQVVRDQYMYAFRIGGADNADWESRVLYRISADNLASPDELFHPKRLLGYRLRRYWNRLRGR
jgi:peptidoglycan/xylan/chitin deacetylase (PgdA/CDA1 family)